MTSSPQLLAESLDLKKHLFHVDRHQTLKSEQNKMALKIFIHFLLFMIRPSIVVFLIAVVFVGNGFLYNLLNNRYRQVINFGCQINRKRSMLEGKDEFDLWNNYHK